MNTTTILIPATASPMMLELKVGPHKTFKTNEKVVHFISLTDAKGGPIALESMIYTSGKGSINNVVLGYPLTFLTENEVEGLSRTLQDIYLTSPKLWPIFKKNGEIYWAKLTNSMRYFDCYYSNSCYGVTVCMLGSMVIPSSSTA